MKLFFFNILLLVSLNSSAGESPYTYSIFTNSRMSGDYFFSTTTAKGSSSIRNIKGRLPVSERFFYTPGNALLLEYTNGRSGTWQASVFRQQIRGQDHFKRAEFLSFWIHPQNQPVSASPLLSVRLMLKDSSLSESYLLTKQPTGRWSRIIIPVKDFKISIPGDASEIIAIVLSQAGTASGKHVLYIDDIEFISGTTPAALTTRPRITLTRAYSLHDDIFWEAVKDTAVKYVKIYCSTDGKNYRGVGIQSAGTSLYTHYDKTQSSKERFYRISYLDQNFQESSPSLPVNAIRKKLTDEDLLTMVQEAQFRYYWDGAEKTSGLAKENIPGRHTMIATGASGFGMMALLVGTERNFISRGEAVARFTAIVNFLQKANRFHGAFPHFLDGSSGRVEPFFGNRDNGGDLVETSFLVQGLLAARAYFNENNPGEKYIRETITSIWNKIEWNWYRQHPDSKFLYWHWSPDQGWIINHPLIGWNETMITYLLAIASPTHPVAPQLYYSGWANLDSLGPGYRTAWGGTNEGSLYKNGNSYFGIKLDVGVSSGGPLFFTHYSYLGYHPAYLQDRFANYFINNRNIARINQQYCISNPGNYIGYSDSCWGLTASDGPYHYSANEPVLRQDEGKIAPTGALSSFPYTPTESMKALRHFYEAHGKFLWGEYGFRDAFNLSQNWCSDLYMGLNQAPVVVMIENYRTGLLWNLFMSDPDIKEGLRRMNFPEPIRK